MKNLTSSIAMECLAGGMYYNWPFNSTEIFRFQLFIGVCIDTYVFYHSVLEKKTYESQIWSVCIVKRCNVIMP